MRKGIFQVSETQGPEGSGRSDQEGHHLVQPVAAFT